MPEANLDLLREAASARTARQFVERTLIDWHLGAFVSDATLLVSELVSNAIVHAVAFSSRAELRLLAGDEVGAVAAGGGERVDAHHRDAAAGARRATRRVPFDIAEEVVDRALGMLLTQTAAHCSYILML